MEIVIANIADAEEILRLQKRAYQSEAELYNDFCISPLKEILAEITEQFKTHIFLKAVYENKITGTVRAYEENGTCHIGRLAVDPSMQNKGIGKALMIEIEKSYRTKRYELFSGTKSEKNIYLYKKLGYSIYEKRKYGCGNIEVYYMEKITPGKPLPMKEFVNE